MVRGATLVVLTALLALNLVHGQLAVIDGPWDAAYYNFRGDSCWLPKDDTSEPPHTTCTPVAVPKFPGVDGNDAWENNPPVSGEFRLAYNCAADPDPLCTTDLNNKGAQQEETYYLFPGETVCPQQDLYAWGIQSSPTGVSFDTFSYSSDGGDLDIEVTVPVVVPAVAWHIGVNPFDATNKFATENECVGSPGDAPLIFWPNGGWGVTYGGTAAWSYAGFPADGSYPVGCVWTEYSVSRTGWALSDMLQCGGVTSDTSGNVIRWTGALHATAVRPARLDTENVDALSTADDFIVYDFSRAFEFVTYTSVEAAATVEADASVDFVVEKLEVLYTENTEHTAIESSQLFVQIRVVDGDGNDVSDHQLNAVIRNGADPVAGTIDPTVPRAVISFTADPESSNHNWDGQYWFEFDTLGNTDPRVFKVDVDTTVVTAMFGEPDVELSIVVTGANGPGDVFYSGDEVTVNVGLDNGGLDVDITYDDVTLCFGGEPLRQDARGQYSGGCDGVSDERKAQIYGESGFVDSILAPEDLGGGENTLSFKFSAYPLATRTATYRLHVDATVSLPPSEKRSVGDEPKQESVRIPFVFEVHAGGDVERRSAPEPRVGDKAAAVRMLRILPITRPAETEAREEEEETTSGNDHTAVIVTVAVVAVVANVLGFVLYMRRREQLPSHRGMEAVPSA